MTTRSGKEKTQLYDPSANLKSKNMSLYELTHATENKEAVDIDGVNNVVRIRWITLTRAVSAGSLKSRNDSTANQEISLQINKNETRLYRSNNSRDSRTRPGTVGCIWRRLRKGTEICGTRDCR